MVCLVCLPDTEPGVAGAGDCGSHDCLIEFWMRARSLLKELMLQK